MTRRNHLALTLAMVAAALVAVAVFASPLSAQCGAAMCAGTTGVGKNCTIAWSSGTGICPNLTLPGANMSAMCGTGFNNGTASHAPPSPAISPLCSWSIQTYLFTTTPTYFITTCLPAGGFSCQISLADGLPLELMEFSVESDADSDAETEEPIADEVDENADG